VTTPCQSEELNSSNLILFGLKFLLLTASAYLKATSNLRVLNSHNFRALLVAVFIILYLTGNVNCLLPFTLHYYTITTN